MDEYVIIGSASKEKLIEGMNLITDAIECTYGPNASNVCIKTPYGIKVTKDGKTVAEAVKHKDPFVQAGIDIIKEISQKTADEVGDGSSTVAILTRAIVNLYKDNPNPIALGRQLREECTKIIAFLKEHTKDAYDFNILKKVATLSANNDEHIGTIIAQAFDKVGRDGIVTFEKSDSVEDRVEYSKGFKIDNGFFSPYLINTKEGNVELDNVYVYISKTKMEETKEVQRIWQEAINRKQSLLLMAPDFDSSITMLIYNNMFREGSTMKAGMVISPDFGQMREESLNDIKAILGEKMTCEKVIMTKDNTTFIGYTPSDKVSERLEIVKENLKRDLPEIDRDFYLKRLANLTGGFATIYVGGYSDTEVETRCDLYEDAISATKCAIIGGILPGGGHALTEVSKLAGVKVDLALSTQPAEDDGIEWDNEDIIVGEQLRLPYFKEILKVPETILSKHICSLDECGEQPEDYFWTAADYKAGLYGDAIELGIIEPFLVVKETLENAVSAATNILTTDCVIVNE